MTTRLSTLTPDEIWGQIKDCNQELGRSISPDQLQRCRTKRETLLAELTRRGLPSTSTASTRSAGASTSSAPLLLNGSVKKP